MAYSYETYLQEVTFYDGTTTYTVPIWNLKIRVYPWHSSGDTAVEYFHGKNVQRIQGYRTVAEFEMAFGNDGVADQVWSDLLDDISNNVEWTIDFDPDTPGIRVGQFVMDESSAPLQAMFSGHIRNRPTKTKWISADISDTPAWWISCTENPEVLTDVNDLLLYLPSSLIESGGLMSEWTNLGTVGSVGDINFSIPAFTDTPPAGCVTDGSLGKVVGLTDNDQGLGTSGVNIVPTITGSDDNSEMWIVFKASPATFTFGEICSFLTGPGVGTKWQSISGGKFSFAVGSVERFGNCPGIYDDGQWHVFRTIHDLASDNLVMTVDGYPLDSAATTGDLPVLDTGYFHIGPYNTGDTASGNIAVIKLTDGLLTLGRAREIYAYLRDTLGISQIPADGTETVCLVGAPSGSADIYRVPVITGASASILDNGGSTVDLGYTIRKDDDNQYAYYNEGGPGVSRVKRCDYAGGAITFVTTTSPSGTYGRGLAIAPSLNLMFQTHAGAGVGGALSSHSMDPADAGVAWTSLISTGTYNMHMAIEYNPTDGLLYFIDSLAATPALYSCTTAGASITSVKSLTAGKVYEYLCKDPDNNVLYFTNATDGTIEKYDIDTDTHTTAWHTPTNKPNGLDIQMGNVYYYEETTYSIYKVPTAGGAKTLVKTNSLGGSGADAGGVIAVIFDTTV